MATLIGRREFIRGTAMGVAALTLGGRFRAQAAEESKPVLVLGKGPGVRQNLEACLARVLEPFGGMGTFVKKGQIVLLKPNLGFPNTPEVRATTSPLLVAAVVRLVQGCDPKKILIADYPCRDYDQILSKNGYGEALKGLPADIQIVRDEELFVDLEVTKGKVLKKTKVLRAALDADVHIALPLAKSHAGATFTGVLKGNMGLIWDRKIFHNTYGLDQAIADLNTRVRPHLSIMEGIQVMADSGPVGPGALVDADSLIAGTDPVAVDAAGVKLVPLFGKRVEPGQVKHLALSAKLSVGRLELPTAQVRTVELPAA